MSDTDRYEQQKKERRRLRARQRGLKWRFLQNLNNLHKDPGLWHKFSAEFLELLLEDIRLADYWVDASRYPIAIYNLFSALRFDIHAGVFPRVSGVQPDYRTPFLAYSAARAVLIDDSPSSVFTDLADVQPICPVPILGLAYNSIVLAEKAQLSWGYPALSLSRVRRVAQALALGHFALSLSQLRRAITMHPVVDHAALLTLAEETGVSAFLNPPIDALPVFGQFASSNLDLGYGVDAFMAEATKTREAGAVIAPGDVTEASPGEVLRDPHYYFRELEKARLLSLKGQGVGATQSGWAYLRSRVLPFPLGQLLYHATTAARAEVQSAVRSAFANALKSGQGLDAIGPKSLMLNIEEIDSFHNVALVSPEQVKDVVPVPNSEAEIKELLCRILYVREQGDWGGEQNDIFTTHLWLGGRQRAAAFFLKGPSVRQPLTIAKCGKNGDQIQRLFQSPADVFIIQFNGEIHERVVEEARQKTRLLRTQGNPEAAFCIIDGIDTARLIAAYPDTGLRSQPSD